MVSCEKYATMHGATVIASNLNCDVSLVEANNTYTVELTCIAIKNTTQPCYKRIMSIHVLLYSHTPSTYKFDTIMPSIDYATQRQCLYHSLTHTHATSTSLVFDPFVSFIATLVRVHETLLLFEAFLMPFHRIKLPLFLSTNLSLTDNLFAETTSQCWKKNYECIQNKSAHYAQAILCWIEV